MQNASFPRIHNNNSTPYTTASMRTIIDLQHGQKTQNAIIKTTHLKPVRTTVYNHVDIPKNINMLLMMQCTE